MNEENKVNGIAQDGKGNAEVNSQSCSGRSGESIESPGAGGMPAGVESRSFSSPSSAGIRGLIGRVPQSFTPEQKLLLLDVWEKSTLTGTDFSSIVGVDPATLYLWRKLYQKHGPEGLFPKPKGVKKGMKVDSITRRAIVLLKESHPEYGCERISQFLYRGPGLGASAGTVAEVLREEGYETVEVSTTRHEEQPRRFERAAANQLWQSDLFTFVLVRKSHRVHLTAFMDDYSRFIVGYGLASSPTGAFVLEVFRSAVGTYGLPEEVLTDQGPQYRTWRGKTDFEKEMGKLGVNHITARPRHPETLGKVERFWKSLWEECLKGAIFVDINDARTRIGHYIDHYNFQRPHQGIDGLVPADRYFGAESEIRATLEKRVKENALEIARSGSPADPFYLSGRVGGVGLSVHAAGDKLIMSTEDGRREEFGMGREREVPPPAAPQGKPPHEMEPSKETPGPGESPLDQGIKDLKAAGILPEVGHEES